MSDSTTIQLPKKTVQELKKAKQYERQTYSELIENLLKAYKSHKTQYDQYLHEIQKQKMAELWNNKEDEAWDNV
ncbi:MAG: hypothetical protein COV47_03475 [Candidatus Diapherotrites archaeon CG11_big_fil_rev_8_21_14_0_20_37_9]|nr:MAG: hypothetical protein COV47_03475 [Candidatus Diapherotrites archaeon CG11_big_fil_rev_8_21_14_0_20_37_9]